MAEYLAWPGYALWYLWPHITDASLTDSELAARLAYGLAAVAVVIVVLSLFLLRKMKRRAENKVSESDYHPPDRHPDTGEIKLKVAGGCHSAA